MHSFVKIKVTVVSSVGSLHGLSLSVQILDIQRDVHNRDAASLPQKESAKVHWERLIRMPHRCLPLEVFQSTSNQQER